MRAAAVSAAISSCMSDVMKITRHDGHSHGAASGWR